MGGKQEVIFLCKNDLLRGLRLSTSAYERITEREAELNSRMQTSDREFRKEGLIGSREIEKEELDRVHVLDASMINAFLLTYGKDLSGVNIHTGPFAEEITHKAGADALTAGNDIYFSSGTFAPETEEGKTLLLHELEHVDQHRKGQRHVYKEDVEKAEREAYSKEGLTGLKSDEIDLFERLKQDDAVFKDPDLTDGLDSADKDLEAYTSSEPQTIYRYISLSGRIHELTKEEYESSLVIIQEKLEDYFEEKMMYCSEEDKIEAMHKMVNLFNL